MRDWISSMNRFKYVDIVYKLNCIIIIIKQWDTLHALATCTIKLS